MKPLLLLFSLLLSGLAQAATIHVQASGTLTVLNDPDQWLPWDDLAVGSTAMELWFQVDEASPPIGYGDGATEYPMGPMTLTVNGSPVSGENHRTTIFDDWPMALIPGTYYDAWQGISSTRETRTDGPDVWRQIEFVLMLDEAATTIPALSSTELLAPEWPGIWSRAWIGYTVLLGEPGGPFETVATARADITNLVVTPAPGALGLLLTGLAALGLRIRQHERGRLGDKLCRLRECRLIGRLSSTESSPPTAHG